MSISVETKVGVFFLAGLIILGVITFKVEDLGTLVQRKKTMTIQLPHASSLQEGDSVAMAGVKVGEVKELRLGDTSIEIVLSMESRTPVRTGSTAVVAWGGLLGNRYIDITLGNPGDALLPPGSEIPTTPSIELGALFKKIEGAVTQLQEMLGGESLTPKLNELADNLLAITSDIKEQRGTIGKLVGSDELYEKVMAIADDLKKTSSRIEDLVSRNDERINSILEGLERAAPEAREAFATIKRLGKQAESGEGLLPALLQDRQMRDDLQNALSKLGTSLDRVDEFTKSLKDGKGLIARLADDEEVADDFGAAMKHFRALAENLEKVSERIESGDNTLAKLTTDKELYEKITKLVDDAREALRNMQDQVPVGTFTSVLLSAF